MDEDKTIVMGDFIDPKNRDQYDLSSTLKLRAKSIDQKKLWQSKDRSAEFMGDIWSLFVDPEKEERIKTVLHSVCVELVENSVKYGCRDYDYIITADLCLKTDEILIYVVNKSDHTNVPGLKSSAQAILGAESVMKLFKRKMKEAKEAKKQGRSTSQLGFIRIVMQNVKLAWRVELEPEYAIVTTLARIPLG